MATLKYGVNFLNYLSQQLADLDGITTLAHELIQNADDAKDDAGRRAATRITFDVTDDALVVSNDAVFREDDFERLREVASASKRSEAGDRTTGAFGVGFISVYQITDRPEIRSAGRHWTLRPEEQEIDEGRSENKDTILRLPWAFDESPVRKGLRKPPVDKSSIDSFAEDLKKKLPRAILFLKKLDTIEVLRNGEHITHVKRVTGGNTTKVYCDGVIQTWQFIKGDFCSKASQLKGEFSPTYIEDNRSDCVRVAIPDSPLDDGLLFATLPTREETELPFHINADFFPNTDRKSIVFGDTHRREHRSEWNRAAMEAAAVALSDCPAGCRLALQDMFKDDAPTFWGILERLQRKYKDRGDNPQIPLGAFWERLSPALPNSPVVYTEPGKWVTPAQARIPTGDKEKEAVPAFGALGIKMVHRDLLQYRNILTSIGVGTLQIEHIHRALQNKGMVGCIPSDNPLPAGTLELLWQGIHGVLENTQGRTNRLEAERLLKQCALAPGVDGRLWPCGLVYRSDGPTRKLFAPLMGHNAASFLAVEGIPLLQRLCPRFTPGSAIRELERPEAPWCNDRFDPAALLRWFDTRKSRLGKSLRERLAQLPIFPSEDGRLRPGKHVYWTDDDDTRKLFAPLMGHDIALFLAEKVIDIPLLRELCPQFTPGSAIAKLECLEAPWRNGRFDPVDLLRWFDGRKSRLGKSLRERLTQLRIFPSESGHLRPGKHVYRADERTRKLFAPLMGHDAAPFLAERVMDIPLLEELCPRFTPGSAITELERLDYDDFQAQWRAGSLDPAALLHWFDDHKLELGQSLRERLAQLPIFPSAKRLHPLKDLWLPGGFPDPTGAAELLDIESLGDLTDFLVSLGAQKLTFRDYAVRYIPAAFAADSDTSPEIKRELLGVLAKHIGLITDSHEVRDRLATMHIVECTDGEFRQPGTVYFPNTEVKAILGDHVSYAHVPGNSGSRADLYRWLGIQESPRAEDIVRAIDKLIARIPNQEARKGIARVLDAVGKAWAQLDNVSLLRESLPTRRIIECTDSVFRRPAEVYFRNKKVEAILGDRVSYALLANSHRRILTILGVKDRPQAEDILRAINKLATQLPDQENRKKMLNILEIIGKGKERYSSLKSKAWLPAEGDPKQWYRPDELYAAYNKNLFASRAQFLDLPVRDQGEISEFLRYLGVNLSPHPSQVVSHLLWWSCSKRNQPPPKGIYRWLNNPRNTQPGDLKRLRRTACLHIGGKYLRPDQVFWGQHPFGRFRFTLGDGFRQYPKLLSALGIREAPDYRDAIEVLKEIPGEVGNNTLGQEDKNVVIQCWDILADAFQNGVLDAESIREELCNVKCVLNSQDVLQSPSQMFFEDRPGLADKIPEQLGDKSIPRPERVWRAMEAAGVRPISDVVRGTVEKPIKHREDDKLKKRVAKRAPLIKTISDGMTDDGGIPLDNIRFFHAEDLKVKWHTDISNGNHLSLYEAVSAHLDGEEGIIYFTLRNDNDYPWPDIARELAQAIAPDEEIGRVSPGLKTILEADTYETALADSRALGIVPTEELEKLESIGAVAEALDEAPPSDVEQEPPTSPQDEPIAGDVTEKTPQVERPKPALPLSGGAPGLTVPTVPGPSRDLPDQEGEPPESLPVLNDTPAGPSGGDGTATTTGSRSTSTQRGQGGRGRTQFHSYVAVQPDREGPSPEGAEEADRRLELEESAIDFILECEPEWKPTPQGNKGYDLYKADQDGKVIRWCEVKAMTGPWDDRPVGLTHTQFKKAQECGDDYWLYVVEHAGTADARIVRIQDPAGKARTFTFDHGWREVADVDDGDTGPSF